MQQTQISMHIHNIQTNRHHPEAVDNREVIKGAQRIVKMKGESSLGLKTESGTASPHLALGVCKCACFSVFRLRVC